MTVAIRNSEGKGRKPYRIEVSRLSYDADRKRFSVDDFRADLWAPTECPHPLEPLSIESSGGETSILFEKDVDALKLINWLRTEGVAAMKRIYEMPG